MAARTRAVPVDEDGNIRVWKAVVGAKHSHAMANPVFPRHQPNYSLDKGACIKIRKTYRDTGAVNLDEL